jgi:hypothetical protein
MGDRAQNDQHDFAEMKTKIDGIERLALELKDLGRGMPVVSRNTRAILSFVYALKFGISDVAESLDKK